MNSLSYNENIRVEDKHSHYDPSPVSDVRTRSGFSGTLLRVCARQDRAPLSFASRGLETYIVTPRDSADFDLLIEAVRAVPRPTEYRLGQLRSSHSSRKGCIYVSRSVPSSVLMHVISRYLRRSDPPTEW
jgi:hypothetical protein